MNMFKYLFLIFIFFSTQSLSQAKYPIEAMTPNKRVVYEHNKYVQKNLYELNEKFKQLEKAQKKIRNSSSSVSIAPELSGLKKEISAKSRDIDLLQSSNSEMNSQLTQINQELQAMNEALTFFKQSMAEIQKFTQDGLSEQSKNVEMQRVQLEEKVKAINTDILPNNNPLYLLFTLFALIMAGSILFAKRKMQFNLSHTEREILATKKYIENERLLLDKKLLSLLETQIEILNLQEKRELESRPQKEPEHSLSLKIADEVTRMERSIAKLDSTEKGLKPLLKGIERIKKNLFAEGYEIINLLNKPYIEGMNIDVINYIEDRSLKPDEKTIIKVIRPQVNFNNQMIQRAQVDVAIN